MSLNYTPLRHAMLAAVASDQGFIWVPTPSGVHGSFDHKSRSLVGAERKTLNVLLGQGFIGSTPEPGDGSDDVFLTKSGSARCLAWSSQYGEPTP